ncbi:MAG: hypothetical protein U0869_17130 [Chloroflexota bacterium]
MRWFRRGPREPASPAPAPIVLDPAFVEAFRAVGLAAFDRQLGLAELVGDRDWQYERDRGTIRFGSDLELRVQNLGSVSHNDGSWLWAWANPTSPQQTSARSQELRRLGEERGIAFLVEPQVVADAYAGGHGMGLIASGLLDADAYYRCPSPGGEVVLLVEAPGIRAWSPEPGGRAAAAILGCIQVLGIPPSRASVVAYLRSLGLPVTETAGEVRAEGVNPITITFDELGRMTDVQGRVPAPR